MTDSLDQIQQQGFEASLHRDWYISDDRFQQERETIFLKEWLCVGREEDWPNPGDHEVLELFGESILLVRNSKGQLRAFYNVCRHRGSQLCLDEQAAETLPQGGVIDGRLIRCPYHSWTYDLDGQLLHAPFLKHQEGFDPEQISLHPVGVESWGGFVFLNLSPETAPDFQDMVREPASRISRYPLQDLRAGKVIDYDVEANWKVLCENYNECYHCGPVHPELSAIVPEFKRNGGASLDWDRGIPHREGATTFTASGETDRRSFPGLDEDEQVRHKGEMLLPNLFLSLARDHVAAFILLPTAANRSKVRCLFLFEPFEMEKDTFNPDDAVSFWDIVNLQDWAICESVQKGMRARVFNYGALSPLEDWSLDVRRYVAKLTGLDHAGKRRQSPKDDQAS